MTSSYQDYLDAVMAARNVSAQTAEDLESVKQAHAKANGLADAAVATADSAAASAVDGIDRQLATARHVLESIGRSDLIPSQVRPAATSVRATRGDLAETQRALNAGVDLLRQAVAADIERSRADREQTEREAAERARLERDAEARAAQAAARRRRMLTTAVVAAVAMILLVLILAFMIT